MSPRHVAIISSVLLCLAGAALGMAVSRWTAPPLISVDDPPPSPPVQPASAAAVGPWAAWRLMKDPPGRAAEATADLTDKSRLRLTIQPEPSDVPLPIELNRRLKSLTRGDLVWLRVRARATPNRAVRVQLQTPPPLASAVTRPTVWTLSKAWHELHVVWRLEQDEPAVECSLAFDADGGSCELADVKLAKLNWLERSLPFPPLSPGETIHFATAVDR